MKEQERQEFKSPIFIFINVWWFYKFRRIYIKNYMKLQTSTMLDTFRLSETESRIYRY